jgi:hypothetical protein
MVAVGCCALLTEGTKEIPRTTTMIHAKARLRKHNMLRFDELLCIANTSSDIPENLAKDLNLRKVMKS